MKNLKMLGGMLLAVVIISTATGCHKEHNGQVTFYFASNGPAADVTVNGQTKTVNQYFPTQAPACGQSGTATFDLPAGTYPYTASSSLFSWSGNFTVTGGQCSYILLDQATGSVSFWTSSLAFGNITITLNGQTQTLTQTFTNGQPSDCGVAGTITFLVPVGTYNYSGFAQDGSTWNASTTVVKDECNLLDLE